MKSLSIMVRILRVIFFPLALIRLILVLLTTFFFVLAVMLEDWLSRKGSPYRFWSLRNWGRSISFIIGMHVKVNKYQFPPKFILMPNHRSYIDIFLMAAHSPSVFVAKEEIKTWPLIGQAVKGARMILVKRDDMKSLLGTMNKIKQSINNHISVTVFPEGTTCKGPELKPFKNGTFKIAAELGIPVVPCAISYHDRNNAWVGSDNFLGHFFRQFWKPYSKAVVCFATPIESADFQALKEQTRVKIEAMLGDV